MSQTIEQGRDPQALAKRRAIIDALMANSIDGVPQNVGEGIATLGQAIFGAMGNRRLAPYEDAARADARRQLLEALGLMGGASTAGGSSAAPAGGAPASSPASSFGITPSGPDFNAPANPAAYPVGAANLPPTGAAPGGYSLGVPVRPPVNMARPEGPATGMPPARPAPATTAPAPPMMAPPPGVAPQRPGTLAGRVPPMPMQAPPVPPMPARPDALPHGLNPAALGSGPAGAGPMGAGPAGSGPMGAGPAGSGPMGSGPMGTGTTRARARLMETGSPLAADGSLLPPPPVPVAVPSTGPLGAGPAGSGPMGTGAPGSGPRGTGTSRSMMRQSSSAASPRAPAPPSGFGIDPAQTMAMSAPQAPAPAPSGSPADAIVQGLVQRGLPLTVAQGIAGNLAIESGLNPGINERAPVVPGSRGGYGLAQWTGPRRRALEAFAQAQGRPVDDPNLQLDFLMSEINGSEAGNMRDTLAAATPEDAAREFMSDFLRPGVPHEDRRLAATRAIAGGGDVMAFLDNGASGGGSLSNASAGSGGASMAGGRGFDPNLVMALMDLSDNPYAPRGADALVTALLGQQFNALDPTAQLDFALKQAQLSRALAPDPSDTPSEVREYEYYRTQAQAAGETPLPYNDWRLQSRAASAGTTTINMGPDGGKFSEESAKLLAQNAMDAVAQGQVAQQNLGQLQTLEATLQSAPQGAAGGLAVWANSLGIPVEGADAVALSQAIINRLIPGQRPPGSGPMSDRDVEMFKASLPSLLNQPGGNAQIISVLKNIAQYDIERAQIAQRLVTGAMTPEQAFAAYNALGNPIPSDLQRQLPPGATGQAAQTTPPVVIQYDAQGNRIGG